MAEGIFNFITNLSYAKNVAFKGLVGERGLPGLDGPAGPAGPLGPVGPDGDKGERGATVRVFNSFIVNFRYYPSLTNHTKIGLLNLFSLHRSVTDRFCA